MIERIRSEFDNFSFIIFWLILAALVTLTLFQVHGTLISIAVVVVNNPSLRPIGWSSGSIYGLSRLLWLILGMFWLGWTTYTYEYLRESKQLKILVQRVFRMLFILGGTYISCYVVLFLIA